MPLNARETFPLTHEQAVRLLRDAPWSPEELTRLKNSSKKELSSSLSMNLKTHWYLADKTYPLSRHYQARFGLGHEDDMVRLIIAEYHSILSGENFSLDEEISRLKQHWRNQGVDPLTLERIS